jgi:hypothetical protein
LEAFNPFCDMMDFIQVAFSWGLLEGPVSGDTR